MRFLTTILVAVVLLKFAPAEFSISETLAADRCTGICEFCAVSDSRGCARCGVDANCLKMLKSPKSRYKRVPIPELRTPRLRPAQ